MQCMRCSALSAYLAPRPEDFGVRKRNSKHRLRNDSNEREVSSVYRLVSVVVHIGNMLGGHYIAYTALPEGLSSEEELPQMKATPFGQPSPISAPPSATKEPVPSNPERKWCYISDTVVRLASLEEVLRSKAYICMYERIEPSLMTEGGSSRL